MYIFFLVLFLFQDLFASDDLLRFVSPHTDYGFGGQYLKIDEFMSGKKLSRLEVFEIQNLMRDKLQELSKSTSFIEQRPHIPAAISFAFDQVVNKKVKEGGFVPINFQARDFILVLDLDETLLGHWFKEALKDNLKDAGDILKIQNPDSVVRFVDDEKGNTLEKPETLLSSGWVKLRPGVEEFLLKLPELKGFRGMVFFTAKLDESAHDIVKTWKEKNPKIFKHLLGVYTRNHLTFGPGLTKPSKDLRMFDPTLKHVFFIDDNESRVIHKELNFRIPEFNPDVNLNTLSKAARITHTKMFDYIFSNLKECVDDIKTHPTDCFKQKLGNAENKENAEILGYLEWLNKSHPGLKISLEDIEKDKVFHPDFVIKERVLSAHKFPVFKNFVQQM